MKKKLWTKIGISILISLLLTVFFYAIRDFSFIKSLEMITFDRRVALTHGENPAHPDIAVVLIDEASLKSMAPMVGRWPWPRALFGELVNFLKESGARVILFDILFTEPQDKRDESGTLGENDMVLAEATMNSEKTIHAFQLVEDSEDEFNKNLLNSPLPEEFIKNFSLKDLLDQRDNKENKLDGHDGHYNNYYIPFPEIYQVSHGMGVVEFSADFDGVYRTTNLTRNYQGNHFPVLSLAAILKHPKFLGSKITLSDETIFLGDINVPLNNEGRYLINVNKKFNNYSVAGIFSTIQNIQNGKIENLIIDPQEFKDKIVFIGASAVGLKDLKQTSIGMAVPGVYLHASVVSNFLEEKFIRLVDPLLIFVIIFIFSFVTAMLVLFVPNVLPSLGFFIITLISVVGIGYYLFEYHYLWSLMVSPLMTLFCVFLSSFIYKTFTEGKDKKFLKAAFGNYISPELIDMMFEKGTPPMLGGDVGVRTAFFTDIQGFSSFSEKLSATKLVELLNEYLSAMTKILLDQGGTLDKYEGDAIIAFFGAPMPLEDHATRAVKVAVLMQEKLLELRKKWVSEGDKWPKIVHDMRMRIGINSGEIVTGNMGSENRMNYTMMGDSVNLAARLEEAAKQYGIFTQISHFTKNLISLDLFCFREVDTIRVVGKSEPVTTFEVLGFKETIDQNLQDLEKFFSEALAKYKEKKWDEATLLFKKSLEFEFKRFPELKEKSNPSKIYIERCQKYKEVPPGENWDGVYTLTEK